MRSGKKSRTPHLSRAVNIAKSVLAELGVVHPTDAAIETLAYARNVLVRESASTGARATLVRVGERGIIGVAESLSEQQRRFAIAHELGHFECHRAQSYAGLCHGKDLLASYHRDGREAEANAFAAEFLMPEAIAGRMSDVAEVNWSVVRAIADEFGTSLTASAIRFVDLCPEAVALVSSSGGQVTWTARSHTFQHWIAPGHKLDPYSLAFDYFKTGAVEEKPEPVPISAWVDDASAENDVIEHSIPLRSYNSVLTLLWQQDE